VQRATIDAEKPGNDPCSGRGFFYAAKVIAD